MTTTLRLERADLGTPARPASVRVMALRARVLDLGARCEHPHCQADATYISNRRDVSQRLCEIHNEQSRLDSRINRLREQRAAMSDRR